MSRHALLLISLFAAPSPADDPPPPDPEDPVDYVAWVNAQYSKRIRENAAEAYREAIQAYVADDVAMKLAQRWPRHWNEDEKHKLTEWLKQNERCLRLFSDTARKRQCFFALNSDNGVLRDARLPELTAFRVIAKTLVARARVHMDAGDGRAAARDIRTMLRAGEHLESQPWLRSYLLGLAIRASGYDELLHLSELAPSQIDYVAMIDIIQRADSEPKPPTRQFAVERLLLFDWLQREWVDTDGDGSPDRIRVPWASDVETTGVAFTGSLAPLIAAYDDLNGRWQTIIQADYVTGRRLKEELNTDLKAHKNPVVRELSYFEWHSIALYHRWTGYRNAARLVLHMHAFKAENGRWPKDLEEAGVPIGAREDPFSGEDFVYRLKDGEPLLYSVGENAVDDGGTPAASGTQWALTGDAILWPPAEK